MKTQLTRIVELICDLVKVLWDVLATAVQKIWSACRWRRSSVLGRIMLAVIAFAVICTIGGVCAEYCKDNYGRKDLWYRDNEKELSEHVGTHEFNDGKIRVYNTKSGKYTTPRFDWVADAPLRDTLTVFSRKGKRGFLNVNDGRVVIEAQYDKAWVFSEGLAAVVKEGKIGFVNARNETVLPFQYDYSYRNGWAIDYLFRDGCCTMTDARGACGLIDKEGNWIIEPQYDCIWPPHGAGYRIVKDGSKYGLLNPELQFACPIEYDYIEFADGDSGLLLSQNGRKWQTDFAGNITRPFVVDYTNWIYIPGTGNEENGTRLSAYVSYRVDGCVGVLRRDNGQVVIPAIYESVNMLSETLFEALLCDGGDWILIDADGNIVEN